MRGLALQEKTEMQTRFKKNSLLLFLLFLKKINPNNVCISQPISAE